MMSSPDANYLPKRWLDEVVCSRQGGFARVRMYHEKRPSKRVSLLTACVPKFIGYYEPMEESKRTMGHCSLLIMENCGISVHDLKKSEEYKEMKWATKISIARALAFQAPKLLMSMCAAGFL